MAWEAPKRFAWSDLGVWIGASAPPGGLVSQSVWEATHRGYFLWVQPGGGAAAPASAGVTAPVAASPVVGVVPGAKLSQAVTAPAAASPVTGVAPSAAAANAGSAAATAPVAASPVTGLAPSASAAGGGGGGAVSWVGAGPLLSEFSYGTAGSASYPTSASGDLVFLVSDNILAAPDGSWTFLKTLAGLGGVSFDVYYKRRGAETSVSGWSTNDGGGEGASHNARVFAWRGSASGAPLDVSDAATTTRTGSTPSGNGLTTTVDGAMMCMLVLGGASAVTAAGGSADHFAAGVPIQIVYQQTPGTAGAKSAPTATLASSASVVVWTFAVRPS